MTRALRLYFIFALLAVPAFAQTAATRATLYTEIDTLFADTGSDPITPAQLRQSLENITASSANLLSDTTLTVLDGFTVSSAGTITLKTTGAGDVFINKNTSSSTPWFDGALITGADTTNTAWQIDAYGAQARYDLRRANGTLATPTTLLTGNVLGGLAARGHNGTAYTGTVGSLLFTALGNWSASNYGTIATVAIVPQNQTTQVTAATFGNNSLLSLGNAATFPAWTTDGAVFNTMAATYTNGTSSGTVATIALHSLGVPTLAATSATTYTDAANLYIAGDVAQGTNATLTNSYGLLNAGKSKLTGAVTLGSTINKLTLTAPATGSTLTIADGKTLTASNTLTLTATDGSTLAIGAGGTLGTAAYTAASAYATSAQGTKADNVGAVNGLVKSNGSASFSAASAGTDYVVPAGNVATATALATARTIGNVSFDGTANIVPETSAVVDSTDASSYPLMVDSATGNLQPKTDAGLTYNATTGVLTATGFAGPLTGNVTGNVSGSAGSATGNAATATALATPRAIYGNSFDGSAALTQVIASTYGGTGNGFAKFSGPTTSEKTFTLPDANATLLYAGGDAGTPSALVGTNISGTAAGLTAGTATALQTARTIGGSSFDGTGNVTSFPEPGAIGGTTPSSGQFTTLNASGLLSAATQALIGGSTGYVNSAARPIYIVPVATAATGAAQAIFIVPELVATANSDQIYGTEIKSKLTTAGFTGLTTVNLYLNGQTLGGGGTLATAYQLYIAAGPTATARWGVYQAGSSDQNYFAAPIDVGNADTTLARASAGTLSVEGVNLATETYAQTAAKATKLGSHASPDTTGGAITWATSAVYEVWTNTTTEYDLPAASGYDGKAVIFYVTGTNAITIDPNSSEVIVRDGTAQTGGVTLTLTGAAGNYVCLICDGTRWVTLGYKGTLAAGS